MCNPQVSFDISKCTGFFGQNKRKHKVFFFYENPLRPPPPVPPLFQKQRNPNSRGFYNFENLLKNKSFVVIS